MKSKDQVLLEQAYSSIYEENVVTDFLSSQLKRIVTPVIEKIKSKLSGDPVFQKIIETIKNKDKEGFKSLCTEYGVEEEFKKLTSAVKTESVFSYAKNALIKFRDLLASAGDIIIGKRGSNRPIITLFLAIIVWAVWLYDLTVNGEHKSLEYGENLFSLIEYMFTTGSGITLSVVGSFIPLMASAQSSRDSIKTVNQPRPY